MDVHREQMLRGYLAMLVVEKPYRSLGTGKQHLWPCLHNCICSPLCMLHQARACIALIQQLREVTEVTETPQDPEFMQTSAMSNSQHASQSTPEALQ